MNELITNIIYELLKQHNLYNYNNDQSLKDIKITTYYDLENMKHIKIDLGYETYTVTVD
jgi:hypothetical protein